MSETRFVETADALTLAQDAAEFLTARALATEGRFAICLSGGSTPHALYEILATDHFATRFPWARSYWFFGDERFVPHDDKDSNYRMVNQALFRHVPIPPGNIYPIAGTGTVEDAAASYQENLRNFYGSQALDMTRPLFDVTFMGLGEDGHTASLFPGNPALEETVRWVVPVQDPSVPQKRISLTYPALACSDKMVFLVAGQAKNAVLKRVLSGDRSAPASRATAIGEVIWFVDKAAQENLVF
jgi:6-phosphogluconolactonase